MARSAIMTATLSLVLFIIITAQCTLVHMRGLGIACRPSVCDVGGLWSHRVEILETNYTDN